MKVEYAGRALWQLQAVYEYLVARNPRAAHEVRASIELTIARLAYLPRLGKLTDEHDVHMIVEPDYLYRVFYVVDAERVIVLRILHGSQSR
jgi:plasmid stabilization system protein ParE